LALFDVAQAVLKASGNPKDKKAVANAMRKLQVETPVGRLHWGTGPVANVVATPIPGGQWISKKGRFPLDFVICEHSADRRIPIGGRLKPYAH
jgi:branched-chain amino acid transport system substrate-binding protein